ncbi:hypothetical protein JTE90_016956 [Oedothorax gibbosus]|uniref:Uncharacterized protein n=1 Tax=Oedothorax gibbosus TaxID=931172 RepID=A0AAV6TM69_9ARAC|nr:hypothetical protein JTE90_016956 [Oedothorax gibbosus]
MSCHSSSPACDLVATATFMFHQSDLVPRRMVFTVVTDPSQQYVIEPLKDTCTFSYSDVVLNQDKMNNPIALPKVSRQKNNDPLQIVWLGHKSLILDSGPRGAQNMPFPVDIVATAVFMRHHARLVPRCIVFTYVNHPEIQHVIEPALNTLSFTYGDDLQNSNVQSLSFVHGPFVDVIQVPVHRLASFLMSNFHRDYLKDEYHRDGIACIDTATFHYLQDLLPKVRYVGPEPLSGHPELLAPGWQDPVFQGRVAAEFIKVARWGEKSYPWDAYIETRFTWRK